ncbi:MAG: 50S ribosomal protein L4 [Helicobacter sp.]|nr:50S ribosomal protein L4 [Helicobacter sp.]MDE5815929.1 50S ribosomal protein L4 [Helicobacter sp.]MDE7197071.1 50S ribosomal protein L4 [Helicobacter sp.]
MSSAIVLDTNMQKNGELALPERYKDIHEHNLYLYVKSYLASFRVNCASSKNRGEVSGGGKKPWSQKGGGRARAGSITSPVFVGGGVAHGPRNNRNYALKINKKQKKLALQYALFQKAAEGKLFVVDSVKVESGKTKDAFALFRQVGQKDALFVVDSIDVKTDLAFRNLKKCYIVDSMELNAYLVAVFKSVVIEKAVFEKLIKEG